MGIDAEMFIVLPRKISDDELKKKSYIFGSMFHNDLMLGHEKKIWNKPIDRVSNIDGDGYGEGYEFEVTDSTDILRIPVAGRYYGPGYERGPINTYVAMAEFLEILFPDGTIYYGGDSSGIMFIKFDSSARKNHLLHAADVARDPYIRGFDSSKDGPICPVCEVKMVQNGFGPKYSLHTCAGCGWMKQSRDGNEDEGFNLKSF